MNLDTFENLEQVANLNSISGKEMWFEITYAVEEGTFVQVTGVSLPKLPWSNGEGEPNENLENEDCVQSGYQSVH